MLRSEYSYSSPLAAKLEGKDVSRTSWRSGLIAVLVILVCMVGINVSVPAYDAAPRHVQLIMLGIMVTVSFLIRVWQVHRRNPIPFVEHIAHAIVRGVQYIW